MDRARLIVNPSAGGGRAGRILSLVERTLASLEVRTTTHPTRGLDHARELAGAAAGAGELAIALGGDGLVGAVAGALAGRPGARLGVLPGGRGNDLARALGIPTDPGAACAIIASGVLRELDLGAVDGRPFACIASAGLDSDANRMANQAPAWLGGLVYAYAALGALLLWKPARFEVVVDGAERSFRGYSVVAANTRYYGGGMCIAPKARTDDGLLEVVLIEHVGRLRYLAKMLPAVFKGSHVNQPFVHVLRGREVEIRADRSFTLYADGDPIGALPATVRVVPRAVRVLVPA